MNTRHGRPKRTNLSMDAFGVQSGVVGDTTESPEMHLLFGVRKS